MLESIEPRVALAEVESIPSLLRPEDRDSWRPVDLVRFGLNPPDLPTISELVYPGGRHIVSGEPESLKTWFALVVCVERILAGESVLWFDFEMGPRAMYERLTGLGLVDEQVSEGFRYVEPADPLTDDRRVEIETMCAVDRPAVAVIDSSTPALELLGLDPNAARDIEVFQRALISPLRRSGAAVIQLDHLVKAKEGRGRYPTGSERKLGVADVHLSFKTIAPFGRGKTGRAAITVHKDRHGHLPRGTCAELELRSDPDERVTWDLRFTEGASDPLGTFRPTCLMERVSRYLESCTDLVSRNTVLSDVAGKDSGKRQAIDCLIREGFVESEPGSRNAQLLRSAKPYREAFEDQS